MATNVPQASLTEMVICNARVWPVIDEGLVTVGFQSIQNVLLVDHNTSDKYCQVLVKAGVTLCRVPHRIQLMLHNLQHNHCTVLSPSAAQLCLRVSIGFSTHMCGILLIH